MTELNSTLSWAPGFVHTTAGEDPIPFGFREEMEDFIVEEVPRRKPEGEGEHCWILVEKRGVSTSEAIRRLARRLNLNPRDLGFAGRKDARAVARQWISAPGIEPISAIGAELGHVRVLAAEKATRRLRLGGLAGNRFNLFLRRFPLNAEETARRVLAVISSRGLPNWFGPQRFGHAQRSQKRKHYRQRHIAENLPGDTLDKDNRHENTDRRHRCCDNGPAHLAAARARCLLG